ncbi:unnamed protein product [Caenorhabditis angaria]|uniref:Uncharacterized protein n=1 Tax=Caenorhabditis angaria TaxID=860376 RepID=A0A9P1IY97_9PELO|nr:unnamed protein product [Caenorhabditis angaria]
MALLYNSNQSITNDTAYKLIVEQKFGNIPDYVWCDNCIFFDHTSIAIIIFFISGMIAVTLSSIYCIITAFASFSALNEMKKSLSTKTLAVQRNFIISLLIMNVIHVVLIALPITVFLSGYFIEISSDLMVIGHICIALITQHGTVSTSVFLTTNKAIRQVVKQIWK